MNPRLWIPSAVAGALVWLVLVLAIAHASCQTHRCWHRVHVKNVDHWLREHRPWLWRWRHLPEWERTWARCVASFETRGVPWHLKAHVATGNGYFGSTQWLPKTWHDAGGTGLPTEHGLREQLVRTVWWARRAGPRQWSTSARCGR